MKRIIVNGVSKEFKIGYLKNQGALARFISLCSGREPRRIIWVLKEISFSADSQDIVGIIGKNGSGKSTLLRIIAGIYDKTHGKVVTNGKIVSLIQLKDGMSSQLAMRDNLYLIASLLGLTQEEIKNKFDSMVEFAELGDFIHTKIYQFSEGMKQRLIFSIAIHCNPEILLLDEVFEVGDERFRIKSANKIKELTANGSTILLVSHNLDLVEKYCNRVIWLENGRLKRQGSSSEIVGEYKMANAA